MAGTLRRHWKRWLIAGVALVAVLAVAGPYVYINHIKQEAPEPLSLDSLPESTETPAARGSGSGEQSGDGLEGAWRVRGGSQAGYRVDEVLFGQDTTAVGRTEQVSGDLEIEGASVVDGTIVVDLASVASDSADRDSMFRGRIMNTDRFPDATFEITEPVDLGGTPEEGEEFTTEATGDLTIHGETNPVTFELTGERTGEELRVTGAIPITFADYGVDAPNLGGISVEDRGLVEFLLAVTPA
jgi:polyisoprenoid-binding protein YceI